MNPGRTESAVRNYLAARAVVGAIVGGLLFLPPAPWNGLLGPGFLLATGTLSMIGVACARRSDAAVRRYLAASLVADVVLESILVAATGATRSPYVLLYSLSIAASGVFFGAAGSLIVTGGGLAGYWGAILAGQGRGEYNALLATLFIVLLGLLVSQLMRRVDVQGKEVVRVQQELERVLLDAETIVASIPAPLLCIDRAGTIRRGNAAAWDLLDLGPECEGSRLQDVVGGGRLAPFLRHVEALLAEPPAAEACEIEIGGREASGAVPIEVAASAVRDRGGHARGLVLLMTDLTRHKLMEAEAARRERLAVLGELSGHLAHEIRNSLKPIVGSIELLRGEVPTAGVAGELFSIITKEGEALEAFLTDFLTYARDKSLQNAPVSLDGLVEDVLASLALHPARRAGVAIRRDRSDGDVTVWTDRASVRDILRNLVLNALEATEEGSVTVRWVARGEDVEVIVDDTGCGLPSGDPELLFEPFCSHKPGGTGLGLAIARRLAGRLGGTVSLQRDATRGTRACLHLSGGRLEKAA